MASSIPSNGHDVTPATSAAASADDDASVVVLVEQALDGARQIATHEATLVLAELARDGRALRRALTLALIGSMCVTVSIAWAGIAFVHAASLGDVGLAFLALVVVVVGALALVSAHGQLPPTILGESRVRLERRVARVKEGLR